MKYGILILAGLIMFSCAKKEPKEMTKLFEYPDTKKVDSVNVYFGTEVSDPYVWLENDTAADVNEWVQAQNAFTENYLTQIPYRDKIKNRLTELWNYPKQGVPFKRGDYYFFFKNDGLQPQSILYIQKSLDEEPELFLDPNKLSEDGTVALTTFAVSKDNKYFAYSIAKSGSDWNEFFIMDIASKTLLNDHLKWIKFSGISWYKDGFFYSHFDAPSKGSELTVKNVGSKVYYHKVGDDQSQDELVYFDAQHPERNFSAWVSDDERFVFLAGTESTSGNSLYFRNLEKGEKQFTAIDRSFDYEYNIIGNIGDTLYIQTNYKADNFRLIAINTNDLTEDNWMEIIPQKDNPMQAVLFAGDKLIVEYMKDVVSRAYAFDYNGKFLYEIKMPGLGTLSGFSGKKDDTIAFYGFTSFTFPSTVYKYDVIKNESSVYFQPEIKFDLDNYETKQVFYESIDGTQVPMFITAKKGLELNGNNPTLLYAYGGFNIPITPSFSVANLVFLENGGVFCVANIRGGSEYGEAWHKAGMRENKQNVFDDFISAAHYLIDQGYTSSEKLAIRGGSNGGLLVGAVMTQKPDLFKVALPAVGVMDMLKYHKFTIGYAWSKEYGSSDDSTEFKYIYAYSPLHNIREGVEYPATLVTTADHDDRVVPAHSFKFIATLQEKHKNEKNPVLIRIETKAGHGAGKSTQKVIDEYTDIWSFVFYNLDVTPIYE